MIFENDILNHNLILILLVSSLVFFTCLWWVLNLVWMIYYSNTLNLWLWVFLDINTWQTYLSYWVFNWVHHIYILRCRQLRSGTICLRIIVIYFWVKSRFYLWIYSSRRILLYSLWVLIFSFFILILIFCLNALINYLVL